MGPATSDVMPPRTLTAVRARTGKVLEAVATAVTGFARGPERRHYRSDAPPALTATSSLAEGAGRIFAEEALRLGLFLDGVMPFRPEEPERSFTGPGPFEDRPVACFHAMLTPGDRQDREGRPLGPARGQKHV